MSLSNDIVREILRRVDGITLASAECCCSDVRSVVKEQGLWEDVCSFLWPSTANHEVKQLILSLGGFKKFYANCFPLINVSKQFIISSKKDCQEFLNPLDEDDRKEIDDAVFHSDYVSVVDIHYNNEAIYSKIVWEIPAADDIIECRSSSIFPLVIDLPCGSDGTLVSVSINREEDIERIIFSDNLRLSWILINRRTKNAVNLSSWRPLEAQKRDWGSNNDFTIRFGSILPAHSSLPLKLGVCNIVVKGRIGVGQEGNDLQITGVSMQLEDMMGCQLNARDGLFVLQRAAEWGKRTKNYDQVIQSCFDVLEIQNDLMEENLGAKCHMDPLCMLLLIGVAILSWYYFLKP
ncbi:hypothetical protein SUGI_1184040 [Cryptomeria japonica]|uniref:probable F-box protein At2g36090 n=1 Tax=Cryptomeria japonica TaxID=3369 RepID=UPI00241482FA|nr:probable F-box protein At2g36090 [Cryptomeria japonica]GLJ55168.1 hypothetical protein SUGI_1184040 [Cryptomeria japonica]